MFYILCVIMLFIFFFEKDFIYETFCDILGYRILNEGACFMKYVMGLLILCGLIMFHELGHFIAAKLCGVYVEEFALGMGPCIVSHVSKKSGTKYSLHLVPVGGFCAMKGEEVILEEDTSESEYLAKQDADSFQNVSVWKRIAIVAAGPIVNLCLGLIIAIGCVLTFGYDVPTIVEMDPVVSQSGVQKGDIVTSMNGTPIGSSSELYFYTWYHIDSLPEKIDMTVDRNGESLCYSYQKPSKEQYGFGMSTGTTKDGGMLVLQFMEHNALEKAGVKVGDEIIAINDVKASATKSLSKYLEEYPLTQDSITITWLHDGQEKTGSMTPIQMRSDSIGFSYNRERQPSQHVLKDVMSTMKYQGIVVLKSLGGLVTGRFGIKDMTSPVGIVNAIGDSYESVIRSVIPKEQKSMVLSLWNLILMITVNLGIFNLMPLPALDGGRLCFLFVEAIRKKRVSMQIEQQVHHVGLLLFLGLSVVVIIKDLYMMIF